MAGPSAEVRYVKAFARRSVAYEELEKWHDAFEDLKKSVELDPSLRAKDLWQKKLASFSFQLTISCCIPQDPFSLPKICTV